MTAESLARALEDFLASAPQAVAVEDGEIVFDFASARYSISAERERCLLHLWSEERNVVRRVLDLEYKNGSLQLSVQRFGQARPHRLEICRDRERRSPAAQKTVRARYARLLERVLGRRWPECNAGRLRCSLDISGERTFSPVYARGLQRRGRSAWAVLGVNAEEPQSAVDAALTFGLLWLHYCREREAARLAVEGLRLFLPPGRSAVVRARMAQLDHGLAKFELFELQERDELAEELDCRDSGNIATRLVAMANEQAARQQLAASIARVQSLAPEAELAFTGAGRIAFRLHGLEFAQARMALQPNSFRSEEQLVFGAFGHECAVTDDNAAAFAEFVQRLRRARRAGADARDPLFRLQPERWLESRLAGDVSVLDERLDASRVYSQVPAFAASDRAMIDLLCATREGRLAVLELKAEEDLHLPLQGLDYWSRVRWHQERGEFQPLGYFAGRELSAAPPLLYLVAPAMRVHPATDVLLRYLGQQVEWMLLGIDERWREQDGLRVVFRKRRRAPASAAQAAR